MSVEGRSCRGKTGGGGRFLPHLPEQYTTGQVDSLRTFYNIEYFLIFYNSENFGMSYFEGFHYRQGMEIFWYTIMK